MSQELCFLDQRLRARAAATTDDCDGMLCSLLPSRPLLCSLTSLPTSSPCSPPYPPPTLRAKPPRGSRSDPNPAFSKSFAGKLFSQSPQKAERLPDTTKPARVSLPLTLPPVLFFFCTLVLRSCLGPLPHLCQQLFRG